ncbi:MAG: FtsQ-type POTRA domain-containing protein [Deltaproteobacteria bacterium]|nr:FtsQ-type POTRA domain-containing protein [Deltaproteobacteria bacterium]
MKRSLISNFSAKKNRLKRRSQHIFRDMLKAFALVCLISVSVTSMIYGYHFMICSPYFKIKETIVRGCKELTEKEILALASVQPEQSIFGINANAVERRIAQNPWVKDVYVGRELPDRLVIEVVERTAVALINRNDGFHLMDFDGVLFKKLEHGDNADLPVLSGCYTEGNTESALFKKSLELLRYLSSSKEFLTTKNVSEIHGNEVFGLSLFTSGGLCLRLGFNSYENKLMRLVPVMEDLERRNLNLGFLLIDLNDPTKITVQKKNVFDSPATTGTKKAYRI